MAVLNRVNEKIIHFVNKKEHGGAGNYYRRLCSSGDVFTDSAKHLISYILENYNTCTKIHEIGCGAGQIGHALSLFGYDVTGSEINRERYRLAVEIGKEIKSGAKIINSRAFNLPGRYDVAITDNFVGTDIDIASDIWYYTDRCSTAILNTSLYGHHGKNYCISIFSKLNIHYSDIGRSFVEIFGRETTIEPRHGV